MARLIETIPTAHLVHAVLAHQMSGQINGYSLEPVLAELERRHPTDLGVQLHRAKLIARGGDVDGAVQRLGRARRLRAGRSILYPADDATTVVRAMKDELEQLTRPRRIKQARLRARELERQRAEESRLRRVLEERQEAERAAQEARRLKQARDLCRGRPGRPIYHTTHLDNLAAILSCGRLLCDSRAKPTTSVSDRRIKERRRQKTVHGRLTVADCVPFYFTPTSPMMHRVVTYKLPARNDSHENLAVLVAHTNIVIASGAESFVTDGNAATAATRRFEPATEEAVETVPDWSAIRARSWEDEARRRWQAEFLVCSHVPVGYLDLVAVPSRAGAARVQEILAAAGADYEVRIEPGWFVF